MSSTAPQFTWSTAVIEPRPRLWAPWDSAAIRFRGWNPWPSVLERFEQEFGRDAVLQWGLRHRPPTTSMFNEVLKQTYSRSGLASILDSTSPLLHAVTPHGIDEDASPYWKTSVRRPWYAGIMDRWSRLWRRQ